MFPIFLAMLAILLPAPDAPLPTSNASHAEAVRTLAEAALRDVEAVRGVTLTKPVERRVSTTSAVRAYVESRFRTEYPGDTLRLEETRYRRLGLVSPDAALLPLVLDALDDELAGLYDPEGRVLHISEKAPTALLRPVLLHEWAHALQHERVDLVRVMRRVTGFADANAAMAALLEGDATATGLAAMAGGPGAMALLAAAGPATAEAMQQQLAAQAAERGIPEFLAEEFAFSYGGGLAAVLTLWREGGWAAVDDWLVREPPLSSEHVLHPERARGAARDCPQLVTLPGLAAALPAGTTVLGPDAMGEAGYRVFLRVHVGAAMADPAASGWEGDAYTAVLLGGEGRTPGLLLASVWESDADADELVAALAKAADAAPALAGMVTARRGTAVAVWLGEPTGAHLAAAALARMTTTEVCDRAVFEGMRRP